MIGSSQLARIVAVTALCLACVLPASLIAQTAMGDDPCGAATATPTSNCGVNGPSNNFTSPIGYTDFLGGAACSGVEKPTDGWIKFTATSIQTSIYWTEALARNSVVYLYEETAGGACPGTQPTLSPITCINNSGPGIGAQETILATTTTIGITYYLRIKSIVDAFDDTQSGYLCIVSCALSVFPQAEAHASCADSCDGIASVTPTGGLSPIGYLWDASASASTDSLVTGLCDGIYNVTLTDSAGCALSVGISITEPAAFSGTLDSTGTNCHKGDDGSVSVTTSGGTVPYTYLWSSGSTTSNSNALTTGLYTVTVQDAGSCGFVDSIFVPEPDSIVFRTRVFEPSCNGFSDGEIRLDSIFGETPFNYKLDTGALAQYVLDSTFTGLAAGTYTIIVRDVNLCDDTISVTVGEPTQLLSIPIVTPNTCSNICDGTVGVNPFGGTAPYSYAWASGATGQLQMNVCPGIFDVTITDNNGCLSGLLFGYTGPDTVKVAETHTDATCFNGSDGTATLTVTNGVYPFTYNWTNTFQYDSTLTGLASDTYHVTVTDATGCTDTLSVFIDQPDTFLVFPVANQDTFCIEELAVFMVSDSGGNAGPATFFWNNGVNDSIFADTMLATISYSVYGVDPLGCQSEPATISVFVHPDVSMAAFATEPIICEGATAELFGGALGGNGGPYTITIDNQPYVVSQDTTIVLDPDNYPDPVTYLITATDGCSPPVEMPVTISYHPSPTVSMMSDITGGCNPVTINFSHNSTPVLPQVFYDFGDGQTQTSTSTSALHTYFEAGDYVPSVTVVHSGNGCSITEELPYPVSSHPIPTAEFSFDPQPATLIDPEIQFTDLSVGNIFFWQYTFYDIYGPADTLDTLIGGSFLPSPTFHYPDEAGEYDVELVVRTLENCIDTTRHTVRIDEDFSFWAPNAFTPNNDLRNDVWKPVGIGWNITRYSLYIFSRHGELIFDSNDPNESWDGLRRDNGKPCQTGVYVWKVIVEDISTSFDNEKVFTGHVTLLR